MSISSLINSYRQLNAPGLFLGAFQSLDSPRTLVGYVCSTIASGDALTHSSMSTHVPTGASVCIHSVAVHPDFQRRGIALALLKEYINRLKKRDYPGLEHIERILLITHEELVPLYSKAGFQMVGESAVQHGSRPWFEMRIVLDNTGASHPQPEGEVLTSLPPNISQQALLEALSASSSSVQKRNAAPVRTLDSFGSRDEVLTDGNANKHKLVCLREGCGSLILLPKVAALTEAPSLEVRRVPPCGLES
ncbi:acyl-CoA N-acyltransferase [Clavulina sp. PMI_390]|nr:acyl-CoA N-acyltransferase [Clavulina sp. PMI_390]